jgi:DNA replication licensing factor MCM3
MSAETHSTLKEKYNVFLVSESFGYVQQIIEAIKAVLPRSDEGEDAEDGGGRRRGAAGNKSSSSSSSAAAAAAYRSSRPATVRLVVKLNDLRSHDGWLAACLLGLINSESPPFHSPQRHLLALESAAQAIAVQACGLLDGSPHASKLKIGINGDFGDHHVSPRSLASSYLFQLMKVEGLVTKCSAVRPKLVTSAHYCPKTGLLSSREYMDNTDIRLGLPVLDDNGEEDKNATGQSYSVTNTIIPQKDKDGNPLETEFGLCQYKDYQVLTLQELPEYAPMGQLPRSVDASVEYDLVDTVKPGDRVQVTGIFLVLTAKGKLARMPLTGMAKTVLLCNYIQLVGRDTKSVNFVSEDIMNIKEIGKRGDVLDILGRSIAPSIYGHDYIKRALVLQLLGGVEKNLENGTHLRGDINILMVGDPSTAKSQLLRTALQVAALAISTTGRGSSGVGLTAAVTMDAETGDKRLEAGAMVLADRGLICIDEFDKMSEQDRVAIHEVMEQQTVTIAKAGIHASLNARCSVLAAANPVYGQYDKARRPQENIGLPDSLLSRFDLLFLVLDQLDPENDRNIAEHVLRGHRYRKPGSDMAPESLAQLFDRGDEENVDEEEEAASKKLQVWVKSHHAAGPAGGATTGREEIGKEQDDRAGDVLCQEFVRKYIFYAKATKKPVLEENSREYIAQRYSEMRSKQDDKTLPITARSLETIIRLSSAHAKLRLCEKVEIIDCKAAMDILSFALYNEDDSVEKKDEVEGGGGGSEGEGKQLVREGGGEKRKNSRRDDDDNNNDERRRVGGSRIESNVAKLPLARFIEAMKELRTKSGGEGFSRDDMLVLSGLDSNVVNGILSNFVNENKLMVDESDGMVYFL